MNEANGKITMIEYYSLVVFIGYQESILSGDKTREYLNGFIHSGDHQKSAIIRPNLVVLESGK